ncbi:hypothetical protein KM043_006753 [Ampulex compressa]|nr:hypothetical protein KM043_006753 [Ampulex compressa]
MTTMHGVCSCSPLKYTHIDLHGHLPRPHHLPYAGNPVLALSYCYLIQGKCLTVRNDLPFEMQYVCEVDCKPVCVPACQPCPGPCAPPIPDCGASCPTCPPTRPCQTAQPSAPCKLPCQPCQPVSDTVRVVEPMCLPNVPRSRASA